MFEVIQAARGFELWDLVDLVFGQVGGLLTTSNIAGIFQNGFDNDCPEVVSVCTEFIINNFQEVGAGENGDEDEYWTGQIDETLTPETVGGVLVKAINVGWNGLIKCCKDYIVTNFKTVASDVNNLRALTIEDLLALNVQLAKSL